MPVYENRYLNNIANLRVRKGINHEKDFIVMHFSLFVCLR